MYQNLKQWNASERLGGREMGYWFESMNTEDMDIQKARRERDEAKKQRDEAQAKLKEAQEKAQEKAIQSMIKLCQEFGITKEQAVCKILETYTIDENIAKEKVDLYWKV